MSDKLRKKLNKILDMPSEIVLNTPKITLDSNESILIENYKGILEYSDVFACKHIGLHNCNFGRKACYRLYDKRRNKRFGKAYKG